MVRWLQILIINEQIKKKEGKNAMEIVKNVVGITLAESFMRLKKRN